MNAKKPLEIIQNPKHIKSYQGNDQIKDHHADLHVEWEPWEEEEYFKCLTNSSYFAANYVKIINLDEGLVPFNLYPYQEKMYKVIDDNRFSIVLAPRQSGKSIAFVIWLLHHAIFNPAKTIVIAANKLETAVEMLSRVKLALENLPFFLQPGCQKLNEKSIVFSNKSKIYARATGKDTLRGLSANVIYLDEFAFVENSEQFYTSTYPIIASGKKSKIIITSTANGVGNVFYTLWERAIKKKNDFGAFEVKWNDVPGRDEKWREETIARTSERQFMQEFENKFLGSANTLIDGETLLGLVSDEPIYNNDDVKIYEKPKKGHDYVITADVSEGVGGDFSAFSVIDVTERPFQQVAVYNNDRVAPFIFAEILAKYGKLYNQAFLCVESNDHGSVVNYSLLNDLEYENLYTESWQDASKIGLKQTKKTKRLGCTNFKDLLEGGKLKVRDNDTIQEICKFVEKQGTYKAENGCHDDLVMTLVLFGYLASTEKFKNEFNTELKTVLYSKEVIEKLEKENTPPFGVIDYHDEKIKEEHAYILFEKKDTHSSSKFVEDDIFGVVIQENQLEDETQNFLF